MTTIKFPPLTVEEAVDYLQANMLPNYDFVLATTKKEDLCDLYLTLGAYASNILGLWSGNDELMESCRLASGKKDMDADDASLLIIEKLWERLQYQDSTGLKITEQPDEKKIASYNEILMFEDVQSEALINLLDRKGIISKRELLEEIKQVKKSMLKQD